MVSLLWKLAAALLLLSGTWRFNPLTPSECRSQRRRGPAVAGPGLAALTPVALTLATLTLATLTLATLTLATLTLAARPLAEQTLAAAAPVVRVMRLVPVSGAQRISEAQQVR